MGLLCLCPSNGVLDMFPLLSHCGGTWCFLRAGCKSCSFKIKLLNNFFKKKGNGKGDSKGREGKGEGKRGEKGGKKGGKEGGKKRGREVKERRRKK